MHARVVTVELRKDKMDDFARLFENEWLPALRQAKGFHDAYLLSDHDEHKVMGMVFWDTEADLRAFEGEFKARAMKAAMWVRRKPEGDVYEMTVKA